MAALAGCGYLGGLASKMTIQELNSLTIQDAEAAFSKCCGARNWVRRMVNARPFVNLESLIAMANSVWEACNIYDGAEAFMHHPQIGGTAELAQKFASTSEWASGEQASVNQATTEVLQALADGNVAYKKKFGYIFIVCATGKSAAEMLDLLNARLPNTEDDEIRIAMAEQMKITIIRLEKLLTT